jgi:hypothetical protein
MKCANCSICFEAIDDNYIPCSYKYCSHKYHIHCIEKRYKRNKKCIFCDCNLDEPIINEIFNLSDQSDLFNETLEPLDSNIQLQLNNTDTLIQLNGHDRFSARQGSYFNYVQPYQHHSSTPSDGVNVYSFALFPEEVQPSGSVNISSSNYP